MQKIISIFLSILLLTSSSGIAYAQHFCGGNEMLAKITLGEEHLSCGMNVQESECGSETILIEDHDCCENQYTIVKTDDNFSKASFELNLHKTFAAVFVSVFEVHGIDFFSSVSHIYSDYSPPPIDKDIPVLYQTFLI